MKSLTKILLCILLSGCSLSIAFAQADSATICFSQENIDSSFNFSKQLQYRYMDINLNLKDETWLFKLGIMPFEIISTKNTNDHFKNLGLSLAIEKKIIPPLSAIIQNTTTYNKSGDSTFINSGIDIGFRYYFLMQNRIKKGVSGNNCNGVYLDFFVVNLMKYDFQKYNITHQNFYNSDFKYHNYSYLWNNSPSISFAIGVQKKLNNFSYFDIKLFAQYKPKDYYKRYVLEEYPDYEFKPVLHEYSVPSNFRFGIDFKIGMAWGL